MAVELILSVIILAFVLEFFDASLGMGYGTTMVPLLLLLGFPPLQLVPAILLTNVVIGIVAGFFHHRFENVNFRLGSVDFKVMAVLAVFGIVGVLAAILVAVNLPEDVLKAYIGLLVMFIGILVLTQRKKRRAFHWKSLFGLGTFAAFNKGMTGGGYGPVIVGGQILTGVEGKKAIGVALLAEGLVSIVGVLAYLYVNTIVVLNWSLVVSLLIGGLLSVPLAAYVVRKFHPRGLNIGIGVVSIILGAAILAKLLM